MVQMMTSLGEWNWFILAGILLLLELVVPGAFMIWLGLAAILVGIVSFAIEWSWQTQVIAFAVLSLALVPVWRRVSARVEGPNDRPYLNRRADGYVGRVFTLDKPIIDGVGTIHIDDTVWRVAGPDCPAGSQIKIAGVDGANLVVVPA